MGSEVAWIVGADCPHCDRFTAAVPGASESRQSVMYCPCGVIFLTRNTYRRRSLGTVLQDSAGERNSLSYLEEPNC